MGKRERVGGRKEEGGEIREEGKSDASRIPRTQKSRNHNFMTY